MDVYKLIRNLTDDPADGGTSLTMWLPEYQQRYIPKTYMHTDIPYFVYTQREEAVNECKAADSEDITLWQCSAAVAIEPPFLLPDMWHAEWRVRGALFHFWNAWMRRSADEASWEKMLAYMGDKYIVAPPGTRLCYDMVLNDIVETKSGIFSWEI